jgi:hypothetical protein
MHAQKQEAMAAFSSIDLTYITEAHKGFRQ